jgi:predicted nucleic acid-binding Zn ribbon protein
MSIDVPTRPVESGRVRGAAAYTQPMPTYVYAIINEDGSDGATFEIVQRMSDPPLATHPESGKPVRRVIQAPNLPLTWSDSADRTRLSNKNLDRLGFTKYERAGDGTFEKKAGQGPNVISAD